MFLNFPFVCADHQVQAGRAIVNSSLTRRAGVNNRGFLAVVYGSDMGMTVYNHLGVRVCLSQGSVYVVYIAIPETV
jgi:hypothetical protein